MFKKLYFLIFILPLILILFTQVSFAYTTQILSVGSYNIKNQEQNLELMADFNLLKHLEVIALQEVQIEALSQSVFINPLMTQLEKIWKYQCAKPINATSGQNWEAQVILSQFPIEDCGLIELDHSGDKTRMAIWAKIILKDNQPLLFINTDHETNDLLTFGYPDRKKQLQSLIDNISNCQSWLSENCEDWPVILTGDFNTNEISLYSPLETVNEIQKTVHLLETIGLKHVPGCIDHKSTFTSFWGDYELDHIFVKNIKFSCRYSIKERLGSDHYPIWGVLQIF